MSYLNGRVPDAPWIGMCKEEWEEQSSRYGEEEEDYLADQADLAWDMMKEEETQCND